MKYVKEYKFNNVDTRQTACIELQAPPNAATEGAVGVLAINVNSPTYEVYKCVAVNGSVYTWVLLSSGMSTLSSRETGEGKASATFTYASLRTTEQYVVKVGDLILDSLGYLYRIIELGVSSCTAEYCYFQMNSANGVSISNIEQTLVSTEAGGTNEITITLSNGNTHTFTVKNGINGNPGKDGTDGRSITKAEINSSGELVLTYSDGTSSNAGTVKGKDGTNGTNGINGTNGKDGVDGATPYIQDGYWYINGASTGVKAAGTDGKNGTNGTNGTNGKDGTNGTDGVGIASINTTESTASGGTNVVKMNLTDGTSKSFNVLNGKDGANGKDGKDGTATTSDDVTTALGYAPPKVVQNIDGTMSQVQYMLLTLNKSDGKLDITTSTEIV